MASTTTDRRFGVNVGQAIKVPVQAATTANITLEDAQTVDGVSLVAEDRCLVKNQTDGSENGIYIVQSGDWVRAPDWDGSYDVKSNTLVPVDGGTINNDTLWYVTTANDITIGTTSVAFGLYATGYAALSLTANRILKGSTSGSIKDTLWNESTAGGTISPVSTGQSITDFEYRGYFETVQTVTSTTAGALSFSLANGNVIYHALTQNTTFLGITDLTSLSSKAQSLSMEITQPGTDGYTFTYSSTAFDFDFGGGSTHKQSTGSGETDLITAVARGSTAATPVMRCIVALTGGSSHA
jgi:phage-related tail fiber protein